MTPVLIAVLLLVTSVLFIVGLAAARDTALRSRELEAAGLSTERSSSVESYRRRANARLRRTTRGRNLDQRLAGADLPLGPADFIAVLALVCLVLMVLLHGFLGNLGSLVVGGSLVVLAFRWLDQRRQKRVEAFIAQLPDLARVMGNATSAGLAVRSGIELVERELAAPASAEFGEVARQMALGQTIEQALTDLNTRLPSRELNVLVRTILIQGQAGGAMGTSLLNIATTLENRRELRREVRTAVSGAMFGGYLVVVVGVGSVLLMNVVSPGALDQLARTLIGQLVLFVAATLFIAGFLVIRRLTRIDI